MIDRPHATITKSFTFSASHQLQGLPADHPCSRLHGHNYEVTLRLEGFVSPATGFVVDYRELGWFKQYLDGHLDHYHLNDRLPQLQNPTAELLAGHLAEQVAMWVRTHEKRNVTAVAVSVSETPKTNATVLLNAADWR